jgi:predicted MPP superfamily phosphohydrolase
MGVTYMRNFIFFAVISVLSFLIYVYPLKVLAHLLFEAKIIEPADIIPTAIIALTVFVYFRTHATLPLLSGSLYYGMGIGFIGFFVFNIGLLASLALPEVAFETGLICLAAFVFACVKSIMNGQHIHLKNIHFTSSKVNQHYNLVFFSDVHLGSNSKQHLEKICKKIDKLDYDHLLIGGDLYDSSAFEAEDLNPLKFIQKPILFVTGNHEYYVKDYKDKIAALANYNIRILDNESVQFGGLNIIGISDNQAPKLQSKIAQSLVSQDSFNVLMVHRPSIWDSAPARTDLMLSGHTHNGQIFPFKLLVRLHFKNVYGIYKRLNSSLYVSSGSGTWGPRMRLGTQNEIVQISISPQSMV